MLSRSHTWLVQAENLLLFGPSGVGKTHLAIAITMAMIAQDQPCRFFPATALVQLLQKAKASLELPAPGSIRSHPEGRSSAGSRHPSSLSSPLMS
ncbi:istB-like ATP binding family protein [Cyanobium sp. NS01]|nr:istB-like ATP binding family protein [Cyanobium sp. NS01]